MRIHGITSSATVLPAAQELGQSSGIHWIAVQVQRALTTRGNRVYQAIVLHIKMETSLLTYNYVIIEGLPKNWMVNKNQ